MTAQKNCGIVNPKLLDTGKDSGLSFVFFPAHDKLAYEYLTQLLPKPSSPDASERRFPPTSGELMFGGGSILGGKSFNLIIDNVGITDDSGSDFVIDSYLCGALERYFSGSCSNSDSSSRIQHSCALSDTDTCTKHCWSGIMGLSADLLPWVGRVPSRISGRTEPEAGIASPAMRSSKSTGVDLIPAEDQLHRRTSGHVHTDEESTTSVLPLGGKARNEEEADVEERSMPPISHSGEWIAAGYTGEGMVHAWLCARAVGRMILGLDDERGSGSVSHWREEWTALPREFLISEKRVRKATL